MAARRLPTCSAGAEAHAQSLGLAVDFRQTNHEGELVGWIQEARDKASGIVLNAGALTHTSIALLDALNAAELPAVEVHLSNVFKRESFRHHSYVSPAAVGVICGFGAKGYLLALEALAGILRRGARAVTRPERKVRTDSMAKDAKDEERRRESADPRAGRAPE